MNRSLNLTFTPFPKLETERLILDQLQPENYQTIFYLRSDAGVNKYLDRQLAQSYDDALNFISRVNGRIIRNEAIYWGIFLKSTNQLIGTICIWNISKEMFSAETGYELIPVEQGKGYVSEALETVMSYGFEKMKLKKMEAYVHPQNIKSIKVLEKFGFCFVKKADKGEEDIYEVKNPFSENNV